MKLLIVNSNTSDGITDLVRTEAVAVARPETRVTAITAPYGPRAIETPEDIAIAAEATHTAITRAEAPFDAAIIACFSDPGLTAARRDVSVPVIGIAEAAMFNACILGARFSILTVAPSAIPSIRQQAASYGIGGRLAGVHALAQGVLESHAAPAETASALARLAAEVISTDRPDVLVLGGAVTAGMARGLASLVPVPVLDGLHCAVRQAELWHYQN